MPELLPLLDLASFSLVSYGMSMAIKYCYTGLINPRSKDNDEVDFYP